MSFRRGFKTEAERLALELRSELGVALTDRFDPEALAKHLCIPVLAFSAVQGVDKKAVWHLTRGKGRNAVSAVTIYVDDYRRVILYNDSHAASRLVNSLAHELSHVVLEHQPEVFAAEGQRDWNADQEDEASWLGGCLLIPRDTALLAAREGLSDEAVAIRYGTSNALAKMRMNTTGVRFQAANGAGLWRRRGGPNG